MNAFEKMAMRIRQAPILKQADWLWNPVRPMYEQVMRYVGRHGLERIVNGVDRILISSEARGVPENYEPDVWRILMGELKSGDTFVDIGAHIGLYSIAVAVRLRGSGRVAAFEPDSRNFSFLRNHVRLNRLEGEVELHRLAISDRPGSAYFLANGSSEARLASSEQSDTTLVEVVTLDGMFAGERVDILKIDVEGYEEMVLRGADDLMHSPERRPRAIFVEVHPYAWPSLGTTSESLLSLLSAAGYQAETVQGEPVRVIDHYGEIVARVAS